MDEPFVYFAYFFFLCLFTTDIRFHFLTLQVSGLDKSNVIVGLKITQWFNGPFILSILVYQLLK